MSWGEYMTICLGYQKKERQELHKYRNILAGLLKTNPKELFYMPGDINKLPEYQSSEEIEAKLRKLGNKEVMKLHGIAEA